jgi:hypothetical protein
MQDGNQADLNALDRMGYQYTPNKGILNKNTGQEIHPRDIPSNLRTASEKSGGSYVPGRGFYTHKGGDALGHDRRTQYLKSLFDRDDNTGLQLARRAGNNSAVASALQHVLNDYGTEVEDYSLDPKYSQLASFKNIYDVSSFTEAKEGPTWEMISSELRGDPRDFEESPETKAFGIYAMRNWLRAVKNGENPDESDAVTDAYEDFKASVIKDMDEWNADHPTEQEYRWDRDSWYEDRGRDY